MRVWVHVLIRVWVPVCACVCGHMSVLVLACCCLRDGACVAFVGLRVCVCVSMCVRVLACVFVCGCVCGAGLYV